MGRWWIGCLVVWLGVSPLAAQENWPGWRGPRGDGTSHESGIATRWHGDDDFAWKVPVAGSGHASPVVWQDQVFLTAADEQSRERLLVCHDLDTGAERWKSVVLTAPLEEKHRLNSFASSTPATDGRQVYVSFLQPDPDAPVQRDGAPHGKQKASPGWMVVAAFDMQGQLKWKVRPGGFNSTHGFCSPPVLWKNLVLLNGDHDGQGYLVALDRETGETVWKVDRPNRIRSYSVPLVRELAGQWQMILSGSQSVTSYDPANGELRWIIDGPTEQFVASVVEGHGLIFMTGGFPDRHLLAIRPDGSGNVTDTHIAWRSRRGAGYVPSPVVVGDYLLLTSDEGVASCYEAKTGEQQWIGRLGPRFSGSPVTAEGLAYFTDDEGTTKVIRPGPKMEIVAENSLGERCFSSPAISQGRLLIRGEKHLICITARPDGS